MHGGCVKQENSRMAITGLNLEEFSQASTCLACRAVLSQAVFFTNEVSRRDLCVNMKHGIDFLSDAGKT